MVRCRRCRSFSPRKAAHSVGQSAHTDAPGLRWPVSATPVAFSYQAARNLPGDLVIRKPYLHVCVAGTSCSYECGFYFSLVCPVYLTKQFVHRLFG